MSIDRHIDRDDFWTDRSIVGTASTAVFEGQDGLDQLGGPAAFSAPEPSRFRARLTGVEVDHVALRGFAATPYRSARTPAHIAVTGTPLLTFVFPRTGTMRVELSDASFVVGPEEFFVVDSRDPVVITAASGVRVLASAIGIEHVPMHLLSRGTTISAPLQRTLLVDSFVAFQATILSASTRSPRPHGDQLVRAMSDLHAALLTEAQRLAGEPTGSTALRYRMEEYIDAHMADVDLDPATIARAVGISLRHAHSVFNEGDRTIGKFILHRRIEAVAFTLRTSDEREPLADLAERHGFSSAGAMSRAFRDRYGRNPTEYRAEEHRSAGAGQRLGYRRNAVVAARRTPFA